jgi:O-antigen/teichoic acid export membrane protein
MYTSIDAVILGVMRSDSEVAWYSAAYRVYDGLTYAPAVLSAVLIPRLSALFLQDRAAHRDLLTRALLGSISLGIVLGGIGWWGASWILPTIFGTDYAPGVAPLEILSGGALFVFATWILHAAAISIDLERRLIITTIVGLTANVALNLVFIPRWGIAGAAWATVLAEALTAAVIFAQVWRRLAVRG